MAHHEGHATITAKKPPAAPQEHLVRCDECGASFDMRDLSEFTRHMHPSHKRAPAKEKRRT